MNKEKTTGETTSHFEGLEIVVRFQDGQPWTPEVEIPEGASPPMMYAAAETIRFLADLNMSQQMAASQARAMQEQHGKQITTETKMPISLGDFLPKRKGN